MAFTLDADPSSATMNCFATLEEADDYFEARFDPLDESDDGNSAWPEFSEIKKTALLVTASRELDTFTYGGLPTKYTQPMKWPRTNVYGQDGVYLLPGDAIPTKLKEAVFELAYWRWTESDRAFSDTDLQQIESYKAGPVDYKALTGAKTFPVKVVALLNAIGPGAYLGGAGGKVGVTRISL